MSYVLTPKPRGMWLNRSYDVAIEGDMRRHSVSQPKGSRKWYYHFHVSNEGLAQFGCPVKTRGAAIAGLLEASKSLA